MKLLDLNIPIAEKTKLSNGLTVLTHSNDAVPKIDIILDLKVRHFYDPEDRQGLINFMSEMLLEGTQDYSDLFCRCSRITRN